MGSKKYDWTQIQKNYDAGSSWRDLCDTFGMCFETLRKAKTRGDFNSHRNSSEATRLTYAKGRKPSIQNEGFRKQLSKEQSMRNRGGKCKWYEVSGQNVQGTWERDIANKLNDLGIPWTKVGKKESDIIWYMMDGKQRAYTPDFYLPKQNIYLEIKGYWWGRDAEKMKLVMEQHPNLPIIIVEKRQYLDFVKHGILERLIMALYEKQR